MNAPTNAPADDEHPEKAGFSFQKRQIFLGRYRAMVLIIPLITAISTNELQMIRDS